MTIFSENKTSWAIGISCAFLPGILGWFAETTANIPDIKIPFWLFCIFIASPLSYIAARKYSKRIKNVANKNFGVEKVKICGKHFVNCKFSGTELEYDATADTSMSHCNLSGQRITFSGGAIRTMHYLIALYSDPAFRPIVEQTFDNIKNEGLKKNKET